MPIRIAVPKETTAGEKRVALVPNVVNQLTELDCELFLQTGAGIDANYLDSDYHNVKIVENNQQLYHNSQIILKVHAPNEAEIAELPNNAIVIGLLAPYKTNQHLQLFKDKNITAFAMELLPRITRAQSMDALSSQAAVAGYKAAIMAANHVKSFFPMLTTAAGTIRPLKVLVVGAGVAGLQAIATAHRLGAIVTAYDIRPAAKEQIESLGAKMVDLQIDASGSGGYARELTSEEKAKQQEILAKHVAANDVIITTAAIPGRPAPKIITTEMVKAMQPGSLIIDIAAETGGNCELTKPGETITHHHVDIMGTLNIPSLLARNASDMYARNLANFLKLIIKDGKIDLNWQDQILTDCAITHAGEIKFQQTTS